jgi:hypothetical protein
MGNVITASINLDHEPGEDGEEGTFKKIEICSFEDASSSLYFSPNYIAHDCLVKRLVVMAGTPLCGNVVVTLIEDIYPPTSLTLEATGKEKTWAYTDGASKL